MNRMPATPPLSRTLLGALLALGTLLPTLAIAQDGNPRHERWQRQPAAERRQDEDAGSRSNRPREEAVVAPRRESPPPARVEPPERFQRPQRGNDDGRRENWGEQARQQMEQQRMADQQRQQDQREQARQQMEQQRMADQQRQQDQREQARQQMERQRMADQQRDMPRGQDRQDTGHRSPQQVVMQQALDRDAARNRGNDDRDWRGNRDDNRDRHDRIPRGEQDHRIEQQRRQQAQWQRDEYRRRGDWDRHSRDLEHDRRNAQYRYQRDYWRRWQAEQARWRTHRFDYDNDPFFYTPYNYRYSYGGRWYSTNSYGAQILQQAIRDGYREGWSAGQADRYDRWRFDYRNNYGYIDGSFGYPGYYVSFDDYRYYFRQGFERGYRDGYYGRYQYGYSQSGGAMILPAILGMILAFSIH